MKKNRNLIIAFILIALIGASCQKYQDGPSVSFISPEKRLIKKWKLATIFNKYNEVTNDHDSTIEFKKNKEFEGHATNFSTYKMDKFVGTWHFTNDKKTIVCSGTVYSSSGNYSKEISYNIDQLRSSDLWITETFYSQTDSSALIGQLDYHYIPY